MISSMQSTFNKGNNVMFIIQKKIEDAEVQFDDNIINTDQNCSYIDGTSTGTRRTIKLKDAAN